MAKARIKLLSRGMDELLNSFSTRPYAERVLAAAKADPHDDTGAYENGLHIEQDETDRRVFRVVSGDRKGHILESRYGILARALDSAGGG